MYVSLSECLLAFISFSSLYSSLFLSLYQCIFLVFSSIYLILLLYPYLYFHFSVPIKYFPSVNTYICMYIYVYTCVYRYTYKTYLCILLSIYVFLNGPSPASFSFIFGLFQTNINTILQQINVKKCPSSIRCRDSNPRPLECESPPITTRPGLPPIFLFMFLNFFNSADFCLSSLSPYLLTYYVPM